MGSSRLRGSGCPYLTTCWPLYSNLVCKESGSGRHWVWGSGYRDRHFTTWSLERLRGTPTTVHIGSYTNNGYHHSLTIDEICRRLNVYTKNHVNCSTTGGGDPFRGDRTISKVTYLHKRQVYTPKVRNVSFRRGRTILWRLLGLVNQRLRASRREDDWVGRSRVRAGVFVFRYKEVLGMTPRITNYNPESSLPPTLRRLQETTLSSREWWSYWHNILSLKHTGNRDRGPSLGNLGTLKGSSSSQK